MNMQQMMIQAQKMQRELNKAMDELHNKEFTAKKAGLITVGVMGDKTISEITIEPDAFNAEDKEMIEEMLISTINELIEQITAEEEAINERITGKSGGLGF